MITRFDHVIIAVRNLEEAMGHYRTLGFDVSPGGRHAGLATHNAIIRFGLDYLELVSIYDETKVNVSRRDEQGLLEFLRKREGGLLGYALSTSTIEQDAERFRSSELVAVGPIALQRMRPDGHLLSWRALVPLVPGGGPGRQPWPFLIQWDVPDEQRLSWEKPGRHPNGVRGWAGVAIAVRDLERAIDFYQRHLGLELGQTDEIPRLAARRATFQVDSSRIDLLMPTGEGPVQGMLEELGEGLFEVTLTVGDLKQARQVLHQGGLHVEPSSEDLASILLPFQQTLSTRLRLIEGGQR